MWFGIVSLFPQMFQALEAGGIVARAKKAQLVDWRLINPRDYALDVHKTVDDKPYGGGRGMVLKPEPLAKAVEHAQLQAPKPAKVICMAPCGKKLTQDLANQLKASQSLILVSGRYEGFDQRFIDTYADEVISIGDYVLTGGELPAMVLIDAITRLLPGATTQASIEQDSFQIQNLLDWPHYTRPEVFQGQHVPKVLLSGDHQAIHRWRQQQALARTQQTRPDLIEANSAEG